MILKDPSLEEMATVLDNARIRNGELRAACPAHGGEDANLSARYENGRLLMKCHSQGCSFTEIIKAVRERLGETSDEIPITRPSKPSQATNGKPYPTRPTESKTVRRIVWDVKDAHGELVAHHVRTDLPDGSKKVSWQMPDGPHKLDRKTAEMPLYASEEVVKAPADALIVMAEGEKATDALRAAGVWAVGTVTGSKGTPDGNALAVLANRRVVLWPDNDEGGFAHMGRIAEGLIDVASEVRWYEWEGAPEKGDAADRPLDSIARELADAPRWSKPPSIEGRVFLGQAIIGGVEPPEELLPDMLLAGKAHNLYAPGGVGKTWVLVWIACELIKRGRKVAIFDLENGIRTYAERFEEMGADPAALDELVYYWPFPRLDSARYAEMLDEEQPDLVMFDSWIGFLASEGRDENVSNDISMWAEDYLKPALRRSSGVLLLDHVPHEHERERGSSRKRDEMDVVWQLSKVGDFDRESTATLICSRMKDREGWLPERLTFEIGGDPESGFVMRRDDSLARKVDVTHITSGEKSALNSLKAFGSQGATTSEWLAHLQAEGEGVSKATLHRTRRKLVEHKKVEEREGRYMASEMGGMSGVSEVCHDTPDIPIDQEAPGGVSGVSPLKGGDDTLTHPHYAESPESASKEESKSDTPSSGEDEVF